MHNSPKPLCPGRIGKFGWKGQTATLSEFVQAACANELGLGNPNHPQPAPLRQPNYKAAGWTCPRNSATKSRRSSPVLFWLSRRELVASPREPSSIAPVSSGPNGTR
jgi:hypothetical protein